VANFVRLAEVARRLVSENGRSVIVERDDTAAGDAAKPWLGPDDVPDTPSGGALLTVTMAFVPPSGGGFGFMRRQDGAVMDTVDQVGLVAATDTGLAGADLETFTRVRDGTRVFRIQFVERLQPAATALLYTLGLVE